MKSYLLIAFALVYLALTRLPISIWYDVGEAHVFDSVVGSPIHMTYDGGPVRPFLGSYTVVVRDATTNVTIADPDGGPFPYNPDSRRPQPLTLQWWANDDQRLLDLPAGNYSIVTCWTVHKPLIGLIPDIRGCTKRSYFTRRNE